MHSRSSPSRTRRSSAAPGRPIASALALPSRHVAAIDESHLRCAALGVSPIGRPDHTPLARPDLAQVRERNRRLHSHAAPVMEMLFEQIAETQSMVVLCDAAGTILHSIGDDDFLARASKVALQPGVDWSEKSKGTNAIGTALIEERPTLVHADEHYLHAHHFLTCSAAPILDPRGNVLGVLDVTGDRGSYHQHTMALVRMSARMIENHWLSDDFRQVMRLHFHARVEFIGTLMEGIVAISPDGRIVGANRGALDQLGLGGAALRAHTLESLFGTTVAALVDRFRTPLALPVSLVTGDGRPFHAHARFDWPVWHSLAEAVAASSPAPQWRPQAEAAQAARAAQGPGLAQREGCGLASLATGDPAMEAAVSRVRRVLDRGLPILLLGETGTGKNLLARAIHQDSARAALPFVALNCAATAAARIEAELLGLDGDDAAAAGRARGARRPGAIARAGGGTLFLDEIDALPAALQARLLHVLRQRELSEGEGAAAARVDLAIVCATRQDLGGLAESGRFREDLYYRLEGLTLRLPALRERRDLPALVQRILATEAPGRTLRPSPEVSALLQAGRWPGNVRQLVNVLRASVVMAAGESVIRREHLPQDFLRHAPAAAGAPAAAALAEPSPGSAESPGSLQALALEAIRSALAAEGGNVARASRRLGISRNTVYRRLRDGAR